MPSIYHSGNYPWCLILDGNVLSYHYVQICMLSLLSIHTYPYTNRFISESIYLSIQTYIPMYPSACLGIHTHLIIYLSIYLSARIYLSISVPIDPHPFIYLSLYPYESTYPFVHAYQPFLSLYLAAYLCTYLLSIY